MFCSRGLLSHKCNEYNIKKMYLQGFSLLVLTCYLKVVKCFTFFRGGWGLGADGGGGVNQSFQTMQFVLSNKCSG